MREQYSETIDANEASGTHQTHKAHTQQNSLIEPYRHELLLHCYRLLGSLYDAEDAVQEAMLRAWRYSHTFTEKGPGSLRGWLYTIATNVSLDMLKQRSPRTLPTVASPAWDPQQPVAPRSKEVPWLEPFPDSWLVEAAENPETRYTRRESVSLAFLTAIQLLPPRQRAILLLADVLSFHADEIAHLLEISLAAVNSALHRARVTLAKYYQREQIEITSSNHTGASSKILLARYLQAWENDDVDALVGLLKEDATLSMPPVPSWYQGPEAIRAILLAALFLPTLRRQWRLLPTQANGQPAFVVYKADAAFQTYQAFAIQVLTLTGLEDSQEIAAITAFLDPKLALSFGFPRQLPR